MIGHECVALHGGAGIGPAIADHLRLGIEPLAAVLAARNATAEDIARGERMITGQGCGST